MKTYLVKVISRKMQKLVGHYVSIAPVNEAGTFQIYKNRQPTNYFLEKGQFRLI